MNAIAEKPETEARGSSTAKSMDLLARLRARPMTVPQLAHDSGLTEATCRRTIYAAQEAGLVDVVAEARAENGKAVDVWGFTSKASA